MEAAPIILFDGICNLCNGAVNFIIRHDKGKLFRFAALQSATGQRLRAQYQLPEKDLRSFILIDQNKAYEKSTAALKVATKLPWYWQWTQLFWMIPRFLRDIVYDSIAKNRYKWFGKKEQCVLPKPEIKDRFI